MKPGQWVMAEDSGLEVDGLGNLPGVHSARYAGPKASDSENVAKLLKMMQIRQVSPRKAKFQCTMVVYTPQGEEWIFTGTMPGEIAKNVKGLHGFGYDPVFIPEGESQTLAELGVAYKNKHSHRARSLTAFIEKLKSL
jgi:XTP/dITP diphosphohydrolase